MHYQQLDKPLIKIAKLDNNYSIKHFHGADKKYSLICRKHKIVIPKLRAVFFKNKPPPHDPFCIEGLVG